MPDHLTADSALSEADARFAQAAQETAPATAETTTAQGVAIRIAALTDDYGNAAVRLIAAARELEGISADLAHADEALRIACYREGLRRAPGPSARELAVEVIHGRCGALRPHLPFIGRESAERAEEQLLAPPAIAGDRP